MVKKLTASDWDAIASRRPARYFIQSVEDGAVRIKFETEPYLVESGKEDGLGNVWTKDWNKIEAKVTIISHKDEQVVGTSKIYSLGGEEFSLFADFIACCKRNGLRPEDIPDKVFEITKTDVWDQVVKYVGPEGGTTPSPTQSPELKENLIGDIKEVIKNLSDSSPDLVALGFSTKDFLKILSIRGKIKPSEGEALLPELVSNNIIKLDGDRITIP